MNRGPCNACGGPACTVFYVRSLAFPACGRHGGDIVRALMELYPRERIVSQGRWSAHRVKE